MQQVHLFRFGCLQFASNICVIIRMCNDISFYIKLSQHVATERILHSGSEFCKKSLVGWRLSRKSEPKQVVLGPSDRSGPSSWPTNAASADVGVTLHTNSCLDRADSEYPPRHPHIPSGRIRHRIAGERRLNFILFLNGELINYYIFTR